jgi:queuine tRNA-ribosyltransferase
VPIRYQLISKSASTSARLGRVHTPHGSFDTPAFMPVGTRGTVKGVLPRDLADTGAQICLGNTYHLLLRPGSELVSRRGGLHHFMNWPGPILTDSGGYQAFSMADLNKVTEEGVVFKSIVDGAMIDLSPQRATTVQNQLGADIIMAFDDCPPSAALVEGARSSESSDSDHQTLEGDARATRAFARDKMLTWADYLTRVRSANERTVRWLERCIAAHQRKHDQGLFGIVQGGVVPEERIWCAQRITQMDCPGFAIGGVAVGEDFAGIKQVVTLTAPLLPEDKPRYLMGVGYERDILAAVKAGVDMFDCVLPTRNARNANAFTSKGQIRLKNAKFAEDENPIEPGCDCQACIGWGSSPRPFTRSYLRHLFSVGEMLGPMLVSLHNLRHFQRLMADIRATILTDDWTSFETRWPVSREP